MDFKSYSNLKLRSFLIFFIEFIIYNLLCFQIHNLINIIDLRHGIYLFKIQIIWFLISYITGRYTQYNLGFRNWFTKYISRTLICIICFANIIFLKILLLQEQIYRPDLLSIFSITYKTTGKLFNRKNYWVYIGERSDFNSFEMMVRSTDKQYFLKNYESIENFSKSDEKFNPYLNGIIIKDNFDISINISHRWQELSSLKKIYSELDWAREF